MMSNFIPLTPQNIDQEHICCAISDKKCSAGYQLKKEWLKQEFKNGYQFRRLDARAKVFIEYGPAENSWVPITAPNYLYIGCFWVSGQYKGKGYAKQLMQYAIDDAITQNKDGLITVAGVKKFHFMSDSKWLIKQGFELIEKLPNGFGLYIKKLKPTSITPNFKACTLTGECPNKEGITVYYSNRCPFTEFHVQTSLVETAKAKNIPLKIMKLNTLEEAQHCPSPATIFSLFYNGKFITTDVSVCMLKRFEKYVK